MYTKLERAGACLALGILTMGGFSTAYGRDDRISGTVHGTANGSPTVITVDTLDRARRWCLDVSLTEGALALEVDDQVFTFRGDHSDPGRVVIDTSGLGEPVNYRFWPDIRTWQLTDEWKDSYAKEFEGIGGWRDRNVRVCVDADNALRRVWVDGRLVKNWRAASGSGFRLTLAGPGKKENLSLRDREVGMGRFLELDLESYFNAGSIGPYTPDTSVNLDGSAQLRFESNEAEHRNMDLGKLAYRDAHLDGGPFQGLSYPYLMCDAMSSDPQRAIFRVPARFYDRLHLLCYADDDEGEVPRAAVRFIKTERARFLTQEFGLVPEEGVRILETRVIGGERGAHVVVDLNPAAFQEFVDESSNDYLEFELTRPVTMDSNTFERPAGPPSSIHVIAMALEEAPVAMNVVSGEPGHLFERTEDAVMQIRLESSSDADQSGVVDVRVSMPGGQVRREPIAFQLPPHGEKTIEVNVGDAPVGKSDLTVRLNVADAAGDTRVMERKTSFAVLPKFERGSKDSPFGMWSFFEGHHGADIETTCEVLRKAGVKGTLTNFILGTEPGAWTENVQRTETLRAHGIEPNWGHLAGIANTALDGLGDLDTKFAWVKAHPQVKYYNLFWETNVSRRAPRQCPPEIRGRSPMEWNQEEQERIDTYLAFGKTWAARARKDAPDIQLCFGNGFPDFTSAMLRAGFPHKYIDGLGLDFDMYTSAPEDQPSMWYAPFSGIYYLRELRKVYQCEDKPIWLTEAIYCPTSPIWITERQQADYYVRAHLLALAMGVERFGMCAEPVDPDGWYHYSHYGPVGLCHAPPEINPREAYCAYAAMTGVLDGATFDAMVDLGSPHAYGLRFQKVDGRSVHALWTVNGTRVLRLLPDGNDRFTAYNRDGRDITSEVVERQRESGHAGITLQLDESPVYLVGPRRVEISGLSKTEALPPPTGTKSLVLFDTLDGWEASLEPLAGYEEINRATPVAWVNLDVQVRNGALNIRPPRPDGTHPLETLCMVMRYTGDPLLIAQQTEAIGVCARGDRSWGRAVFILEDANGNRWVSARSQTPIDVDGEIYLETALPKPPSEDYPGFQGYGSWQREKDDVIPEYPLCLTGLLFEIRTHAIHGPGLVPLSGKGFVVESVELRE